MGNGEGVFFWYKNWPDLEPLGLIPGCKILHEAGPGIHSKVVEGIRTEQWFWALVLVLIFMLN